MKTHLRFLWCCLALLAVAVTARAQLSGPISVPSTLYPTLDSVIRALNAQGVGTGGATITLTAAQTAPVGGYRLGSATLNASTSVSKPLVFNGGGFTLTAYVGTGTADGIFFIQGTDYVTISAMHLAEATANTTNTDRMEWGYSLVKLNSAAPYDGCQNVLITGCNITLDKTYTNTIGIRGAHTQAGSTTVLSTSSPTVASTNSYNNFTSNTISGVTRGISFIGINGGAVAYDRDNRFGGVSTSGGNTITYGGAGNTSYGIFTQYDSVVTVRYNKFAIGTGQTTTSYGYQPSTGVGDITFVNNTFDVNCSQATGTIYGYYNSGSHADPSSGPGAVTTHTISNNFFSGNNPAATSSAFYAIYNYYAYCRTANISNNTIRDINWSTSTGAWYGIYHYYTLAPFVNINSNLIYNINKQGASGTMYGIYNYDYYTQTGISTCNNNTVRAMKSRGTINTIYNYGSYYTAGPGQRQIARNNVIDSIDQSTATATISMQNWLGYQGADSSYIGNNSVTNLIGPPTTANWTVTTYFGYGYYGPASYISRGNRVANVFGGTSNCYINTYSYYTTVCDSNIVENGSIGAGYFINYLGMYSNSSSTSRSQVTNNRIRNLKTTNGYVYNYIGYNLTTGVDILRNEIRNLDLNGAQGYMYNQVGSYSNDVLAAYNRIDSIACTATSQSTQFQPWYLYLQGGYAKIHDNIITRLYTSPTATMYPFNINGAATDPVDFYNNLVTDVELGAGYTGTSSAAIYLNGTTLYRVYHNTVRIKPSNTLGANVGFTGLFYSSGAGAMLDLRNNILNIDVPVAGTGFVTALRRSSGAAGTPPSNFLPSSNGNIFYAPNAANSWIYGEGGAAAGMVNTYNLTSDPNFNTPCGLFKSFMAHDFGSFVENNLAAGTTSGTYRPTGVSFGERGAVPSPVTVDFDQVTRGTVADIGALEFAGTALDQAPPVISYTPVPTQSYCVTNPQIIATITDVTGVDTSAGKKPRLYYKKSGTGGDLDVFGVANNNTGNGWKFVEPTSISGNSYVFNFDYTLLRSTVVTGDTITYFIIAQDKAATPNTGFNVVAFTQCPSTVTLGSANSPLLAQPKANGFRVLTTPIFRAVGYPPAVCLSGSSLVSVVPTPLGTTIQWQEASLTGAFTNITGAVNTTYQTPVLTTTRRYRAILSCGGSTLATTTIDTFIVANPQILSVTPASRCGYGPVTLAAAGSAFTLPKWYAVATGGTTIGSGLSFTTPNISSTTTYYVAGNTPNAGMERVGWPATNPYTNNGSPGGLEFDFRNSVTNFYSTTVYPYYATNGLFMVELTTDPSGPSPTTLFSAGPFFVNNGMGTTPVVLPLNFMNIPQGKYWLMMSPVSGSPYLNCHYDGGSGYPIVSPSGGTAITGSLNSYGQYYSYFYNNLIGADCEGPTRTPVVATVITAPPITLSSPQSPGICLGATANLSVSSPNPDYIYTWQPGSMTGTTFTVSPTSTTTYRVTATDPYTGCVAIDSSKLYVNAQPNPPTITPNPATVCAGQSVRLTGNPPLGAAGTAQIGTTTSSSSSYPTPWGALYTGNHTQYLYSQAELATMGIFPGHLITSYSVYSMSSGGTMQNFQIKLGTTNVTTTSGSMICPTGATVGGVNTVPLTLCHNLATYTPPGTAGWVPFNFNVAAFSYLGGTLVVDITHMNCSSCPATSCNSWTSNGSIAVTSTSSSTVNYAYADGNCAVITCSPSNTYTSTLRASAQFGFRQPADINWLNVNGLWKNSTLTQPVTLTDTVRSPFAAPATTTVYTAITNLQGCKSVPSAPDTVYVVPSPNVTITPAGPQTICAGQTVTLCVPTAVNQTYQWYLNNNAIAAGTSNCFTATANGTYKVTVTNLVNGCTNTSVDAVVTVNPAPVVTVTRRGAAVVCKGVTDTLIASGTGIVTYQWKESGVNIPGATSASLIVTATGTYTVEVTNSNNCVGTSAPETITVNVTPTTITPMGPTTFCSGMNVTLQAPTAPAGTTFTYQWKESGVNITGATTSSYTTGITGSYTVVVTNTTTGCRDSSVATVVNVGPPPSSVITPNGAVAFCTGGNIVLNAVNQPGLCYEWSLNGNPIAGATNASYTATAAGSYTVRVAICANPTTCFSSTSAPAVVTINPLPTATVTAAGPTTFCQGDTVRLNANAGTGLTYQWNFNGSPILGQTGASFTARNQGSYTVTVTNTATGCTNVSTAVAITVTQPPTATVTPAGPTTFCQGGSVNLCVPTGAAGYVWRLNGNPITGATSACYSATTTGLYSVTVSGSTCATTSAPTSVQVNALPNVTTVPTGAVAVCQGYSIALTVGADPNYTYQWMLNNVNISGATNSSYAASSVGAFKVRVTNTITGCVATSADINVTVNTPPTASATLTGPSRICQGDSATISANTGTGFMYQWRRNGVNIAGETASILKATQSGSYTVSVSNATNCFNISNPIVITVDPRPAAFITYATPLEFCEGSAVVLTANTGLSLTYQWIYNGVANGNTGVYNESKTTGTYALRVTNSFGCSTLSDILNILVHPAPVPTIARNGSTIETTTPYISYQWFFNNEPIGGATAQSYTFSENGAYKVRVIDMYGCEGMSNLYFVNNVGIPTSGVGKSIRVYPNPTSGLVNIESSVKVKVVLRDVAGKSILEASDVKQINLGDIANGMYMLYISDMNGTLLRADKITKTAQ